ncbi:hypothetical protein [Bifidobacterium criceti]|uniref:Uncharacterized protein n=1 Tax=Bifidobacterium criceti TaxID=1960969 RepID=A0A2A2EEG4_9BIFI|nr:hypothetical protein [Bifidobacterium criceti]PAU67423.1 hypothetical protein B1526_1146 [Bifidobacterium criceti]
MRLIKLVAQYPQMQIYSSKQQWASPQYGTSAVGKGQNPGGMAHGPEAVPEHPMDSVSASLYGRNMIVGSRAQPALSPLLPA